ncbi:DoxX family membrane protein [Aquimarina sp. MMG016]|uniref:DoxX family membrane protein n=1 Tax=Aquimarina sp. MMG016 TaxID=2822690 RepID=UPI001B3A65A3|nr:DoxX family membrane protein [Aquimarina sp. MMG016]MBQ4819577.1 DoxX family membrane protein [Aquimarina sp. MMG016]
MNPKVIMAVRILFGLAILFFGANKLFYFMDPPEPPTKTAASFLRMLTISKTMMLVAIVEIAAGISLLANKYAPLMMIVLMSISINALLYHLKLDPKNIVIGIVFLAMNGLMIFIYRDHYKELLRS